MSLASRLTWAATASLALLSPSVHALSQVTSTGRYLYTADGNRFGIKGVAYQPASSGPTVGAFDTPTTFVDGLANGTACARDLPFLQQLGVNTIRAYSVDSSLNHDSCMQAFSNAGIYAIIDLPLPLNGSIDTTVPTWTINILDEYIETINTFSKYDNILAYNIGNEVITADNETDAAPFLKAAARDVKAYLNSQSLKTLVGYASVDFDTRTDLADYLFCDDSGATGLDIFGLNNYEWCGDSSFQASYAGTESDFSPVTGPLYFSEFGCNSQPPRLWTEVSALFSSQMTDEWSGGVAFSYFPAEAVNGQFGMVTFSPDESTVIVSNDFTLLSQQYGNATTPTSPSQSAASATSLPSCPQSSSTFLASSSLPPTPNATACACTVNILSCELVPSTASNISLVGDLIGTACGLYAQAGGNCDDISANGTTGTYGRFSFCDPASKLAFVMTQYYEATNQNPASCSFGGAGQVNSAAPTTTDELNAAVSQCLTNTDTTFTPTAPTSSSSSSSTGSSGSNGGGSSSGSSGTDNNGAMGVKVPFTSGAASGTVLMLLFAFFGGLFTLL